jgi:hypothetical protein
MCHQYFGRPASSPSAPTTGKMPDIVDGGSSFPEWPFGLVQRLLPREAEVVEQMPAIGDITQRGALPATFAPSSHSFNSAAHPGHELD